MPSGAAASPTRWRCWSSSPNLLFIRRLDELETLEERRSQRSGQPMRRRIFPEGSQELRWSRFKELGEAASMFKVVGERVFPFLRELGGEESA